MQVTKLQEALNYISNEEIHYALEVSSEEFEPFFLDTPKTECGLLVIFPRNYFPDEEALRAIGFVYNGYYDAYLYSF